MITGETDCKCQSYVEATAVPNDLGEAFVEKHVSL